MAEDTRQKIIFITGMPGSGKSTQATRMVEEFNFRHISAGDCLREEMLRPRSPDAELIRGYIDTGNIVPAEVTIRLMKNKIIKFGWAKYVVVIDGFPRNYDNYSGWNNIMKDEVDVLHLISFECSEEVSINRIMLRSGQNRSDDRISVLRERFRVFMESTRPVTEIFQMNGKCTVINANQSKDEVWEDLKALIKKLEC